MTDWVPEFADALPMVLSPDDWGWGTYQVMSPQGLVQMHSVPHYDTQHHRLAEDCRCNPSEREVDCFTHRAYDGRERYEAGKPTH